MWTCVFWLMLGILSGAALVFAIFPAERAAASLQQRIFRAGSLFLLLLTGLIVLNSPLISGKATGLGNGNPAELALLVKNVNENKNALREELRGLQNELEQTKALVKNGDSLTDSVNARINLLLLATGNQSIKGPGVCITFREQSNLMYYDLIDLVNELFLSGAEAVAINGERFTSYTSIAEEASSSVRLNPETGRYVTDTAYNITMNGKRLSYPLCIQAIGDAATLEKGLDYPGGILQSLAALYGVSPQLAQSTEILIPAAEHREFTHSVPLEK
ncbi:MAG: DUF881 domain-containing protein [Firmicutes bacterium]|nr:DUF881 domain-containing protein [Bacillota bacterium]